MEDETTKDAEEKRNFLQFFLFIFDKDSSNVSTLICDYKKNKQGML